VARRVGIAGYTPIWRRGIASVLADAGFLPSEVAELSEWKPGRDGAAVIVGAFEASSWDSVARFSETYPLIPVVAVIPELTVGSYAQAVRAGAIGVLGADESTDSIVTVLETSLVGRAAAPEELIRAMALRIPVAPDAAAWVQAGEAGWLRQLAAGVPVCDIAEHVGYSEREMFRMLHDLYVRIGVRNRTEAIIWATRHGLLDVER